MNNWRALLVPTRYGMSYPPDFDRNREYEFRRGDDEPVRFRMVDQSPYCNVAGLMWREINPATHLTKP
jgi:hypothetical protein